MDLVLPFLQFAVLMGLVVVAFRLVVRRPRGVSHVDPPGVRTVVIFAGEDPEFFADDREDQPFVGIRLFHTLCDAMAAEGIAVTNRRPVQCAQGADCALGGQRFSLVLEFLDPEWLISVDWAPTRGAERRHIALTHQVFAPHDSAPLRRLLEALDGWLKRHPGFSQVRWLRKERWLAEDISNPAPGPIDGPKP